MTIKSIAWKIEECEARELRMTLAGCCRRDVDARRKKEGDV